MHPWIDYIVVWWSWGVLFLLLLHRRRALWGGMIIRVIVLTPIVVTFVWMRWIEPQQIVIKKTDLQTGMWTTIALISDLHLGVFKDRVYLQRVVNELNKIDEIDMVLIAGDFTYRPPEHTVWLRTLFAPLRQLQKPVYAVLGNHDLEFPGPNIRDILVPVLEDLGIHILNNDIVDMDGWLLVWLGDHDAAEDDVSLLEQITNQQKVVVLTHHPDTTLAYTSTRRADVTLVWHTHGGQIRIPFLHRFLAPYIIPVQGYFDYGLYDTEFTRLFVSSGLGEVLLPMRWFIPPTIDIIRL